MEYRTLGSSDISVSVVGFGCGGNARLMVSEDDNLRLATLERALQAGINYFDTAAAYGDGKSECNLGRDLRALGANPVLSTKVVLQAEDLKDPRSAVLRKFDESLSRLGLERVDVLLLHNRVFTETQCGDYGVGVRLSLREMFGRKGVISAFDQLRASKSTQLAGFTALGGDPPAIVTLIDSGVFGVLNVSLNLLNPSAAVKAPASFPGPDYNQVLGRARDAGMGVMAIQVLARGVLAGAGSLANGTADVARASLAGDGSLPEVAIRYAVGKPGVSTAILGLSEPRHIDEAAAAIAKGPLPTEVEHALEVVFMGASG
jgi:aryl-alcohol dehydrogenase-like predicted oxidoreductase